MKPNTLHSIQFLRFVAAFLVVAFHSFKHIPDLNLYSEVIGDLAKSGQVGVHIFFVISGFIMVYIAQGSYGSEGSIWKFLVHRFVRIFPIFWIVNLLFWVYTGLLLGLDDFDITLVVLSFSLLPDYGSMVLGPAWTLSYELYFYIIFAFTLFFNLRTSVILIGTFFFLSISLRFFIDTKIYPLHVLTNSLLLEFVFGMLVGYFLIKGRVLNQWVCWVSLIVGTSTILFGGLTSLHEQYPTLLAWGVPSTLIVLGVVNLEKQGRLAFLRKLSWLGDSSYSLYLIHMLPIKLIALSGVQLLFSFTFGAEVLVLLVSLGCVVIGVYFSRLVELPTLAFFRSMLYTKRRRQTAA